MALAQAAQPGTDVLAPATPLQALVSSGLVPVSELVSAVLEGAVPLKSKLSAITAVVGVTPQTAPNTADTSETPGTAGDNSPLPAASSSSDQHTSEMQTTLCAFVRSLPEALAAVRSNELAETCAAARRTIAVTSAVYPAVRAQVASLCLEAMEQGTGEDYWRRVEQQTRQGRGSGGGGGKSKGGKAGKGKKAKAKSDKLEKRQRGPKAVIPFLLACECALDLTTTDPPALSLLLRLLPVVGRVAPDGCYAALLHLLRNAVLSLGPVAALEVGTLEVDPPPMRRFDCSPSRDPLPAFSGATVQPASVIYALLVGFLPFFASPHAGMGGHSRDGEATRESGSLVDSGLRAVHLAVPGQVGAAGASRRTSVSACPLLSPCAQPSAG